MCISAEVLDFCWQITIFGILENEITLSWLNRLVLPQNLSLEAIEGNSISQKVRP